MQWRGMLLASLSLTLDFTGSQHFWVCVLDVESEYGYVQCP